MYWIAAVVWDPLKVVIVPVVVVSVVAVLQYSSSGSDNYLGSGNCNTKTSSNSTLVVRAEFRY